MRRSFARTVTVALTLCVVASSAGAHFGSGEVSCGGTAPAQTQCTTNFHDYLYDVTHSISRASNYTGTLESRLHWPAAYPLQTRILRCSFNNGAQQGECVMSGQFPPPVVDFTHSCSSYALGSISVTGGSGAWRCYVAHDASPAAPDRVSDGTGPPRP